MRRALNILFSAILALCAFSVLGHLAIDAVVTKQEAVPQKSILEGRTYTSFPEIAPGPIARGKFQKEFESFVADHVPARDNVLLANAGVQRTLIRGANAIFGFEAYPTYFGSEYCVIPKDKIVIASAQTVTEEDKGERFEAWVKTLNDTVRQHPEIRFVYDCVVRHNQSEFNPTYKLTTAKPHVNGDWAQSHLLDRLDKRIDSFVDSVKSYEEVKTEWMATEEHWTIQRAEKSYDMIAARLGLKKFPKGDAQVVVRDWYGDSARCGLDLDYTIDLEDIARDFSHLKFFKVGTDKEKVAGRRGEILEGKFEYEPKGYHRYNGYYGGGSMEVVNEGENNGKTALMIADSLSYSLKWLIADNYKRTVVLLPGNDRLKHSLETYIRQSKPDDIIIVMHATKYRTVAGRSPKFIGLDVPKPAGK